MFSTYPKWQQIKQSVSGLNRCFLSNFWWLRSANLVKFTEECVLSTEKHVFKKNVQKWSSLPPWIGVKKHTDSPIKKKFQAQWSVKKIMLIKFWGMKWPITNWFTCKRCNGKQCFLGPNSLAKFVYVQQKERISNYYLVRESFCRWGFDFIFSSNEDDLSHTTRMTLPGSIKASENVLSLSSSHFSSRTDRLPSTLTLLDDSSRSNRPSQHEICTFNFWASVPCIIYSFLLDSLVLETSRLDV